MQIIRSNRKTIAIQIRDGKLIVRAPYLVPESEIRAFVRSKEDWIRKHMKAAEAQPVEKLTMEEIRALADKAMQVIPEKVAYYAAKMGVTYGRITIRNQKTRWGSCSSKGNLNFNCLLMLMPDQVVDSVVVHELAHRKQMNHSRAFYNEIYAVYPEYDKWNRWLKEHGDEIMRRMVQ